MAIITPKIYFPFGSCRAVNTIALFLDKSQAQLLNPRDLWFTHYMQEHIQKLHILFSGQQPKVPEKDREMIVRYQQKNHYHPDCGYGIADSLDGRTVICSLSGDKVINIVLELATARSIRIPINESDVWGHSTSIDAIRRSPYAQRGEFNSDQEVLQLLGAFEVAAIEYLTGLNIGKSFNFLYLPPIPYQPGSDAWVPKPFRIRLAKLLDLHCLMSSQADAVGCSPARRTVLDLTTLIIAHGGPSICLQDTDHFNSSFSKILANKIHEEAL